MKENYDEWYCNQDSLEEFQQLEKKDIYQIQKEYEESSINMLKDKNFIQIDYEQAEKLIGKKIEKKDFFILVRGVAYNKNFSDFFVLYKEETLFIGHMSLGHSKKMVKFPVIVNVENIPINVYSSCGQSS